MFDEPEDRRDRTPEDDAPATGPGSAEAGATTGNPSAGAGVDADGTYEGEGVGRRDDVRAGGEQES